MPKIEKVESRLLGGLLSNLLVNVVTEDGMKGTGEAWWGLASGGIDRVVEGMKDPAKPSGIREPHAGAKPIASAVDNILAPLCVGRDSNDIERLWFEMWDYGYRYADEGILMMALSGVDMALWDLLGKRLGVSVAQLLGGSAHDRPIPAYASLPPLRVPDTVISETRRAMKYGFRAVKLHELDPKYVPLLRDEFGPELGIMVDASGQYDPMEAVEVARAMEPYSVIWLEEPLRPMRDHRALARMATDTVIPLAAGENEYSLLGFQRLLESESIRYLQPEITKFGGITASKRVSALAEVYNVALCPHNFRLGPCLYATIQWGFTSPATRWFELPWVPEDIEFPSGVPLPELVDGGVELTTAPGLGVPE